MTMVRLQFIPTKEHVSPSLTQISNLNLEWSSEDGATTAETQDGENLLITDTGVIQYSAEIEALRSENLKSVFDSALSTIGTLLQDSENYRVCLLMDGNQAVWNYMESKEDIEEFASEEFGTQSTKYAEINEDTIKISLSGGGSPVTA